MRRHDRRKPDINVTPLVDVVLVLLIIFMVVTPQIEAGAAVDLPAAKNPDPATEGQLAPIVVSVTARGQVHLERGQVALERLGERLRQIRDAEPNRAVILKGDRAARYDDVRPVLQIVQDLGFPGASLQVGERRPEEP